MSDAKQTSMDQSFNKKASPKKERDPPVTELTAVDSSKSYWKVPNIMLLDVAVREVFKLTKKNDVRLLWFEKEYHFGKIPKEDTILATDYDCPACGERHSASIRPDTVVLRCKDRSVSVFISPTGQAKIGIQCPNLKTDGKVCGKEHTKVLYNIWQSMKKEDKLCSSCRETAVAPKQKKVTRRAKKEKTTESSLLGNETEEPEETEYKITDFSLEGINVKRYLSSTDLENHYFITSEDDLELDSVFEHLKEWYAKILPQLPKTPSEIRVYLKNKEKGCVWGVSAHNKRLNVISYPITDFPASFALNLYDCYTCGLPFEESVFDSEGGDDRNCPTCSQPIEKEDLAEDEDITVTCPHCETVAEMSKSSHALLCPKCFKNIPNPSFEEEHITPDEINENLKFVESFKKDNGTRDENVTRVTSTQLSMESFATLSISVNKLKITKFQFRDQIDEEHLQLLMQSMIQKRSDGSQVKNINPIIVRTIPDTDNYEILSGHHRVAAAKIAGIKFLKCEVMSIDDVSALEIAIISNFTLKELTPLEQARALKSYQKKTSYTHDKIAQKIGKSRSWVSYCFSLLDTPEIVQEKLSSGEVSVSHIRAVAALDEKDQKKVIKQAAEQQLSVRDVEEIVAGKKEEQKEKEKVETAVDLLLTYVDEHPELQEKIISRSRIWQDAKIGGIYDIYIGDLLKSADLDDYSYRSSNVIRQFTDALKEKGLTVVDGEAILRRLESEEREKQNLLKEEKKKKDLCKYCAIPQEIVGKKYCPFSKNLSKTKVVDCEYFVDDHAGYIETYPEAVKAYCFICNMKFEPEDLLCDVQSYRNWYVHSSCRFNLIKVHPHLRLEKCADCKKRGGCDLQDHLLSLIENYDYAVLSLAECKNYRSQNEPDSYTLRFHDYDIILEGDREEVGTLSKIAKFITKHNIDLKHISASEDAESKASLKQLKEAVKTVDSWRDRFRLEVKDKPDNEGNLVFLYKELELSHAFESLAELKDDLANGYVLFTRDQIDVVAAVAEDVLEDLFKRYTLITNEETKSLTLLDHELDKDHLFKDSKVLENYVNKNEISKEDIHPETEDEQEILLAITWRTESEEAETTQVAEDHDLEKTINSLTQPHKIHKIVMDELDAVGMRQRLYPAYSKQSLKLKDLDELRKYSLETILKGWNLSVENKTAGGAVSS